MQTKKTNTRPQLSEESDVLTSRDPYAELMIRVSNGDQSAFEQLYNRFRGPAFGYVLSMVRESQVAEEIVHDAFLKLYRSRASYEIKAKFQTWFWTVLRNATLDRIRSRGDQLEFEVPGSGSDGWPVLEIEDPQGLEDEILLRAKRRDIDRCLQALPPRQREALTLKALAELSMDEIGATMGVPVSAVKSLIFRARESLSACLSQKAKV